MPVGEVAACRPAKDFGCDIFLLFTGVMYKLYDPGPRALESFLVLCSKGSLTTEDVKPG